MSNNTNEVSLNSTQGNRYVPPHLRRKAQETQSPPSPKAPSSPGPASPGPQNANLGGKLAFAQKSGLAGSGASFQKPMSPSKWNGPSSTNNLGVSGTYGSKWKDQGRNQYGPDGLCPPNSRLEEELFAEENSGINFEKYEDIPIDVQDYETHSQIETFTDIDLGPVINNNLKLAHFTSPTPIQKASIPIILKKRDLMACAQTGSGKTASFLFPTISLLLSEGTSAPRRERKVYPESLILAPTRELAIQIYQQTKKFTYRSHLKSVVVYGGAEFRNQAIELEGGCNILVATPGRLLDMTERGKISLSALRYLVIDEADRMLDMGFEPQIRKIVSECPGVEERQTLMFSATFPKQIQKLAEDFLKDYVFLRVGRVGSTTDYITQRVVYVDDHRKKEKLMEFLENIDGLTLVFVETKRLADHLEEYLFNQNYSVISIHGDRTQKERESALEAFKTGQARILVATDVAARGLDVKDVKHVINYDLPHDINDYVHRIGRTGRCGAEGIATAFFNEKNKNIARELIELLEESGQTVESFLYQFASPSSSYSRNSRGRRGGGGRNTGRYGGGGNWGGSGSGGGWNSGSSGGYGGGGGGSDSWGSKSSSGWGENREKSERDNKSSARGGKSDTKSPSSNESGGFHTGGPIGGSSFNSGSFNVLSDPEGGSDSWW